MKEPYFEINGGYISKTEFDQDFFGGYRILSVHLNTKLGQEWLKEKEQQDLDSFYACHPAD